MRTFRLRQNGHDILANLNSDLEYHKKVAGKRADAVKNRLTSLELELLSLDHVHQTVAAVSKRDVK